MKVKLLYTSGLQTRRKTILIITELAQTIIITYESIDSIGFCEVSLTVIHANKCEAGGTDFLVRPKKSSLDSIPKYGVPKLFGSSITDLSFLE